MQQRPGSELLGYSRSLWYCFEKNTLNQTILFMNSLVLSEGDELEKKILT